jgi:hypothetical protein
LKVGGVSQDSGSLHRLGAIGAGRQGAGLFQGRRRLCFEVELRTRISHLSGHGAGHLHPKLAIGATRTVAGTSSGSGFVILSMAKQK